MISLPEFEKKQILFVFLENGEKMSFRNDNLIITDKEGKIKIQCTCYRIFLVYIVGYFSITSGLIQKTNKFGFSIIFLTNTFRPYHYIGAVKEGNTLLHERQYNYHDLEIARLITENKINNQLELIKNIREKSREQKAAVKEINEYLLKIPETKSIPELMGYEGSASKAYFSAYFEKLNWKGRKPRIKHDMINSLLDIGYTLLFSFIETMLVCYGFDTYCGVLHRNFYMRKSLVCDLIEPFRPLIDSAVKKGINLKQFKPEDFSIIENKYCLSWQKSSACVSALLVPLIADRLEIFSYIQSYYRCFLKQLPIEKYPIFRIKNNDNYQL